MNAPIPSQISIQGISTTYLVAGEGSPILMLHGWGAHSGLVWPLAERLIPMGYQVYIPDLPGFGQTSPPPAGWTVHDYVDFVLAYLDALELKQVYLFGHSFGGRLSLVLGSEHAERFSKIALADSAGIRFPPSRRSQARLQIYRMSLSGLQKLGLSVQAERLRSWYTERYGSPDYRASQGVMRETFVRVVNEDLLPYAAHMGVSTLLFWGSLDQDTPLWMGQMLERTIPDAGLVVWDGCGHYSYLERPQDTARVMGHFFQQ